MNLYLSNDLKIYKISNDNILNVKYIQQIRYSINKLLLKMIDLEFAYMGPPAFDLGVLLANYIFSYYGHMSIPEDNDRHRKFAQLMIEACKLTGQYS